MPHTSLSLPVTVTAQMSCHATHLHSSSSPPQHLQTTKAHGGVCVHTHAANEPAPVCLFYPCHVCLALLVHAPVMLPQLFDSNLFLFKTAQLSTCHNAAHHFHQTPMLSHLSVMQNVSCPSTHALPQPHCLNMFVPCMDISNSSCYSMSCLFPIAQRNGNVTHIHNATLFREEVLIW